MMLQINEARIALFNKQETRKNESFELIDNEGFKDESIEALKEKIKTFEKSLASIEHAENIFKANVIDLELCDSEQYNEAQKRIYYAQYELENLKHSAKNQGCLGGALVSGLGGNVLDGGFEKSLLNQSMKMALANPNALMGAGIGSVLGYIVEGMDTKKRELNAAITKTEVLLKDQRKYYGDWFEGDDLEAEVENLESQKKELEVKICVEQSPLGFFKEDNIKNMKNDLVIIDDNLASAIDKFNRKVQIVDQRRLEVLAEALRSKGTAQKAGEEYVSAEAEKNRIQAEVDRIITQLMPSFGNIMQYFPEGEKIKDLEKAKKDLEKAERDFEKAKAKLKRVYGETHPHVKAVEKNLADLKTELARQKSSMPKVGLGGLVGGAVGSGIDVWDGSMGSLVNAGPLQFALNTKEDLGAMALGAAMGMALNKWWVEITDNDSRSKDFNEKIEAENKDRERCLEDIRHAENDVRKSLKAVTETEQKRKDLYDSSGGVPNHAAERAVWDAKEALKTAKVGLRNKVDLAQSKTSAVLTEGFLQDKINGGMLNEDSKEYIKNCKEDYNDNKDNVFKTILDILEQEEKLRIKNDDLNVEENELAVLKAQVKSDNRPIAKVFGPCVPSFCLKNKLKNKIQI